MIYIQFSVFTKSLKTRLKLCKGWPSSQHNPTFSLSHFPSRIFAKCLVQLHVKETHFPFQFHDGVNYKWDWRNLNNTKIYIRKIFCEHHKERLKLFSVATRNYFVYSLNDAIEFFSIQTLAYQRQTYF